MFGIFCCGDNSGLSRSWWVDRLKNAVVPFLFSRKRNMLIKQFIQEIKLMFGRRNQKTVKVLKSLLLIGDHNFCEFLKQTLARTDYNISQINDQNIIRALKERHPDLVVMSAKLNGKPSLNICSELRAGDYIKPIPILIIARQNDGSNIMEFFAEKVDAYLVEPFSSRKLLEQIRLLLSE